jgi:hypothetical protein
MDKLTVPMRSCDTCCREYNANLNCCDKCGDDQQADLTIEDIIDQEAINEN